jgi:UDP-3-O-[3-hydroxymyristoyl] N-acetylglucosamine deacetylase
MAEKRTIGKDLFFSGIGIHSGKNVDLALKPSSSGKILFRRTDLDSLELPLDARKIVATNSSCLEFQGQRIRTLEHLLAALSAGGVDSLLVELSGEEIPILDGSALPFAAAIKEAGIEILPLKKRIMRILKPGLIQDGDAGFEFSPDPEFRISYKIDFDHPAIRVQSIDFRVTADGFLAEIAPARTFGFLKDVEDLRRRGLALGGAYDNVLVLDDEKVVNGPLRYPDEFVRHKVLDLIGDLSLLGCPVVGHFRVTKAGHPLHLCAVRFLLDHPDYWAYV